MEGTVDILLKCITTKGREVEATVTIEVEGGHKEYLCAPWGDTYASEEWVEFNDDEIQLAVDNLDIMDGDVHDRFIDDLDEDEELVDIIGWE